ncbi:unnamed protein product [Cuscuta campestris]|uniref:Ubiquitin-like protease family profile domain-containing protein n=1 Tax=Cuscuta campestris TaxID=132261 RepID=A0A484L5J8_9ASTE|nr:unnamed protein product [Cuscuta campestris]
MASTQQNSQAGRAIQKPILRSSPRHKKPEALSSRNELQCHSSPKPKLRKSPRLKRKDQPSTLTVVQALSGSRSKNVQSHSTPLPVTPKPNPIFDNVQKQIKQKRKREEVESESVAKPSGGGLKLRKRGCVSMHHVVKRKINGQKPTVLFNDKGQPYGVATAEMQSYIGVLARTKAPIWFDTWRIPVPFQEFLREQVCSGVLTEKGDDDVLTKALGKPEHGGRVRGQGMHVRKAVYFNLPQSKKQKTQTTVDEQVKEGVRQLLAEKVNNIVASRDAFWMAEIEKLKSEIWKKQGSSSPAVPSQEASCSPKFREENNDIGDECNHKLSVAEHADEKQNEKEREKNESEDQEIDTVQKLVEVGGLKVEKKAEKDVFVDVDSGESQMAQLAVGSLDNIVAHAKVYGFSRMDDLTYMVKNWVKNMQRCPLQKQYKMISFVDPGMVGTLACGNIGQRSRKLADRFKGACDGQHFLIPFNDVNHWALIVVKPNEEVVYYMDPLKQRIDSQEWTEVVDNAIVLYKNTMNTLMLKKKVYYDSYYLVCNAVMQLPMRRGLCPAASQVEAEYTRSGLLRLPTRSRLTVIQS